MFEFSNLVIGIFIYFPVMKFQSTFLVNFPKSYVFLKLILKIK